MVRLVGEVEDLRKMMGITKMMVTRREIVKHVRISTAEEN